MKYIVAASVSALVASAAAHPSVSNTRSKRAFGDKPIMKRSATSALVEIKNYDMHGAWTLSASNADNGDFGTAPPATLCKPAAAGQFCTDTFDIEANGFGSSGTWTYKNDYTQDSVDFSIDVPLIGSNTASIKPSAAIIADYSMDDGSDAWGHYTIARKYLGQCAYKNGIAKRSDAEDKRALFESAITFNLVNWDSVGVWVRTSKTSDSGFYDVQPPETLCVPVAGSSCTDTFSMESNGAGVETTLTFKNYYTQGQVDFSIGNPYWGSNYASATPSGLEILASADIDKGDKPTASMTIQRKYNSNCALDVQESESK